MRIDAPAAAPSGRGGRRSAARASAPRATERGGRRVSFSSGARGRGAGDFEVLRRYLGSRTGFEAIRQRTRSAGRRSFLAGTASAIKLSEPGGARLESFVAHRHRILERSVAAPKDTARTE